MPGKPPSAEWRRLNAIYLDGETLCACGCGRVADTGDHIIAQARGGEDTEENYQPMARGCNSKKSTGPMPRIAYYSTLAKEIHDNKIKNINIEVVK